MILAIPFVPEIADYTALSRLICLNGECLNHSLYVLAQHRDAVSAKSFLDDIKPLFGGAELVFLPDKPWTGFGLVNDQFFTACKIAYNHKDRPEEYTGAPMLYLHPLWGPCVPRWMDLLQTEYVTAGKLVLGMPVQGKQVVVKSSQGETVFGGAKVFNGPVIIWRTFWRDSTMLGNLTDGAGWRELLRWELTASHKDGTALMDGGKDALLVPVQKPQVTVPEPPPEKTSAPKGATKPAKQAKS